MKYLLSFFLAVFFTGFSWAQEPGHKFSAAELQQDLQYLKTQIFNAHADPFTELSREKYEKFLAGLEVKLNREMTATEFLMVIKPALCYLSDEHAAMSLNKALLSDEYRTGSPFLPFSLKASGKFWVVDQILVADAGVSPGQRIDKVGGEPVGKLLQRCAAYATGFPEQRERKAYGQFGLLYGYMQQGTGKAFSVESGHKIIQVKGAGGEVWLNQLMKMAGQDQRFDKSISYTRYGQSGYLSVRAFDARNDRQLDSLKKVAQEIFSQIKAQRIDNLFIDVSRNSGGNSAVGDMLISFFNDKSYLNYQCNWRRSEEYLALMKSWGMQNSDYQALRAGEILHYASALEYPEKTNPVRFSGNTYVVIGEGTFSSAIMFATLIKDNKLAKLVGKVPSDGHPTHFGELYMFKLPHTRIDVRFGVKQWIRPAGDRVDNVLRPDIGVDTDLQPQQLIDSVLSQGQH